MKLLNNLFSINCEHTVIGQEKEFYVSLPSKL